MPNYENLRSVPLTCTTENKYLIPCVFVCMNVGDMLCLPIMYLVWWLFCSRAKHRVLVCVYISSSYYQPSLDCSYLAVMLVCLLFVCLVGLKSPVLFASLCCLHPTPAPPHTNSVIWLVKRLIFSASHFALTCLLSPHTHRHTIFIPTDLSGVYASSYRPTGS